MWLFPEILVFTMFMQNCLRSLLLACCFVVTLCAQANDSLKTIRLRDVSVRSVVALRTQPVGQPSVRVSAEELRLNMGHSLMDALSHTEGVQAIDIGVGFSKPMIRGLGFQRIAVTENGVRQEGQQWGADHGLEIDAFHVDSVRVVKGPASVLYGSDAMGGAIEILPPRFPRRDSISGEVLLAHERVSSGLSGSVMLQMKRGRVFARMRYTERHWADYRVPADSFTYLSMRLPILQRRLKNTAGMERSANVLLAYRHGGFQSRVNLSDSYQKSGFFSGAHGVPSVANLQGGGSRWDVELPYSVVNHLKVTSTSTWTTRLLQTSLTLGYQVNHREEWSRFHTHNLEQTPPETDPDKELMFHLQTASGQLQVRLAPSASWQHCWGVSAVMQHNGIGGYGFLIPAYRRDEWGAFYLANYRRSSSLLFNASVRYDMGHIHTRAHGEYVHEVNRRFHDYSMALGVEYMPAEGHQLRGSIGRAFRLPSANELTSNGVHHGAFRHELGDSHLVSEQGWQLDLAYTMRLAGWEVSLSPFCSYYPHFISLHPTGRWSSLPDAGQVYQYVDAATTLAGGEVRVKTRLLGRLNYTLSGEYVYTYDHHSHTATPFSPPATMRNTISWEDSRWQCFVECQSVAAQRRVCHNEDATPGYNLFHAGGSVDFRLRENRLSLIIHARNLFNTSYLNHLNFYRKIDLPEAGADIQTTIRFTF